MTQVTRCKPTLNYGNWFLNRTKVSKLIGRSFYVVISCAINLVLRVWVVPLLRSSKACRYAGRDQFLIRRIVSKLISRLFKKVLMYSMSLWFLYPLELYGMARISEITESHPKNLQTLWKPFLLQSLCIYSIYYFVQLDWPWSGPVPKFQDRTEFLQFGPVRSGKKSDQTGLHQKDCTVRR